MASNLRVDSIVPATGGSVSIGTATGGVTIPGNLGIAGVLTYEDVTNIDSVGVITARSGIHISGSGSDLTMNSTGTIFTGNGGNATNPAVVNVSDTNTGYFYPAADTIAVTTGGSERLRIDSSGRLLKSGQAALTSTSLSHPIQVAADSSAQNIVLFGRASDDISAIDFYEADKSTRLGEIQYRTNQLNIRHRSAGADIIFATTTSGGSLGERLRITSEGYVTKPQTPFFSVYGTGNNQTYNQGTDISFENAIQNVGSHFKMTSGTGQYQRFYAPVAGVYIFTFGMFPNSASNCRISLTVNGGVQTNPYISGCFTAWGTGVSVPMGSQMLKLSANDYVTVQVQIGTLTNTYDGHTGFQGFLLG